MSSVLSAAAAAAAAPERPELSPAYVNSVMAELRAVVAEFGADMELPPGGVSNGKLRLQAVKMTMDRIEKYNLSCTSHFAIRPDVDTDDLEELCALTKRIYAPVAVGPSTPTDDPAVLAAERQYLSLPFRQQFGANVHAELRQIAYYHPEFGWAALSEAQTNQLAARILAYHKK